MIERIADPLESVLGDARPANDPAFDGRALLGVYAHLDHARDGRTELRLVLDSESDYRLLPVPVRLGHGSLQAAVEATSAAAREKMERFAPQRRAAFAGGAERDAGDARDLAPVVSLLLYLCADEADYGRPPQGAPRPCGRARAPEAVRCWAVGERVGAALRGESNAAGPPGPGSGERAGPRPHWRRAHWHTFWAGPRDGERAVRVKWLPPVPVNVGAPDALPVTVRPVRGAGGTPPERGDA